MKKPMQTICCNLWGAPGAGKSTLAAYVFAKLKMLGVNCELVTEFAKDKVWEDNETALKNQVYVFANQYYKMQRCVGKVDVLITDSPIGMSPIYNIDQDIDRQLKDLVYAVNRRFNNLDFYVRRIKPYMETGRLHTESQSDEYADRIRDFMRRENYIFTEIDGDIISADIVIQKILEKIKS